jgi:hypothetical protein
MPDPLWPSIRRSKPRILRLFLAKTGPRRILPISSACGTSIKRELREAKPNRCRIEPVSNRPTRERAQPNCVADGKAAERSKENSEEGQTDASVTQSQKEGPACDRDETHHL